MARIDLGPDKKTGQEAWAEVIDPEDLTAEQRVEVRDVIKVPFQLGGGAGATEVGGGLMDRMNARMIAQVTEGWWRGEEPITPEAVLKLPARMFDKLVDAVQPHWEVANFRQIGETSSESATGSTPSSEASG